MSLRGKKYVQLGVVGVLNSAIETMRPGTSWHSPGFRRQCARSVEPFSAAYGLACSFAGAGRLTGQPGSAVIENLYAAPGQCPTACCLYNRYALPTSPAVRSRSSVLRLNPTNEDTMKTMKLGLYPGSNPRTSSRAPGISLDRCPMHRILKPLPSDKWGYSGRCPKLSEAAHICILLSN